MSLFVQSLYEHRLSFLLDKYLEAKYLDHAVGVCLIFKETAKPFPQGVYHLKFPSVVYESSTSLPTLQHLV